MKINDQDIVRVAQELRDEENSKLHIRPWKKHRHFQLPKWLVAVPAAAIVGFVLGLWTQAYKQSDAPLTALVDTIFIEVPAPKPKVVAEASTTISNPAPKQDLIRHSVSHKREEQKASPRGGLVGAIGHPACDDSIRYDLLVCF